LKNLLVAAALMASFTVSPVAQAASNVQSAGKFGVGVQVGYPIEGISMNWFMTQNTSLQFGVALWLKDDRTAIGGRVDYLWWMPKLAKWHWGRLGWHWGPGAALFSWPRNGKWNGEGFVRLGAELAVGIGLQFSEVPIDVNLEAVPVLWIIQGDGVETHVDVGTVLNARYFFKEGRRFGGGFWLQASGKDGKGIRRKERIEAGFRLQGRIGKEYDGRKE
jgi:hypothetical protein